MAVPLAVSLCHAAQVTRVCARNRRADLQIHGQVEEQEDTETDGQKD